jgi:hypothetical protein
MFPICLMGMARIYSEPFFILNSLVPILEKLYGAGPSDGKNDKVSPIFRLPVLAALARPLMVPPYRFLPASLPHIVFQGNNRI